MHLSHLVSVLAVLSATIAAPSPKRHQLETRTHSQPEARQPFNPYHPAHRFAETAANKKRASNYGRDAPVVEKRAKRQIKKRGGRCAAKAVASTSATATPSSSATDYYVPSSSASPSASLSASSSWVDSSSSASSATATSTLNVQQAAVDQGSSSVWSSSTVSSSHVASSTAAPSTTAQSTSAAPATTSAAPSGGDWKEGGHATYFYQNGNPGACGWYKSDSDAVVALNGGTYWNSNYGQGNPDCGRWVTIVNESNGKTVVAQVTDACPTCTGNGESLDLSVGAFQAIADLSQGQVNIKWKFN
ncbi:hypothetical protein NliqN6_3864 [Naganishia liquefaciens]|uniref:RlpA-like protein double-psi beta-barrel domain-containing protein n=1 Tax=Naganishia liquefaciens TaxID=104408 RepID=A0A8H3YGQ9_9TREE|nr:hypothetical protein NliqN6_3864 [Naganishia liquefaciens]